LRQLFNGDHILERASRGELSTRVIRESHPASPLAGEPVCTKSQLIAYYDAGGKKVAEAHQYLRENGTIGLSGQPDPKELLHGGTLYFLDAN
jgi:hypothetical protein